MVGINGKKRVPIGYEDFKRIIDGEFYYIDKTMLVYDLIKNGAQNNLITRPCRFGKTLNFSMLKYFFDIREKDNQHIFDGLKISDGDMDSVNENIWSFLFFTGYLKVISLRQEGTKIYYNLVIPNLEIQDCYTEVIQEYFNKYKESVNKKKLIEALLNKDAEGFSKEITVLLEKSISYHDNKESFYHGLIAGLLSEETSFKVQSNREMGNGRSDLAIYDKLFFKYAIILEFKIADENERIDTAAKRALAQIGEKKYDVDAIQRGYKNILKYGMAFKDKACYAVVE